MVGEQIGHMPKTVAAKLTKYIDNGWLIAEAVCILFSFLVMLIEASVPYNFGVVVSGVRQMALTMHLEYLPAQHL